MTNGQNNRTKWTWLFVPAAIAVFGLLFYLFWYRSDVVSQTSSFGSCLGFENEKSWSVLARPNSFWKPGLAIEFQNGPEPKLLGDFPKACLPDLNVDQLVGVSAPVSCNKSLNYSVSLAAGFGQSDTELASVGLSTGEDGIPEYVTRIKIDAARETALDMLQIENYLNQERFDAMPLGCKSTLSDASRFIIAGAYQIEAGSIEVARHDGSTIDLSLSQFSKLKEAVVKSGFNISASGSITISPNSPPLIIAVRSGDFGKVLKILGINRKGAGDFSQSMRDLGLSIKKIR